MYYDFECIIKNRKNIPIACGLYIKSDYPDILEDKYEYYCGKDIVVWFISKMSYSKGLFKEIFSINIPLKEDSIAPLYISPQSGSADCYYCNEEMGEDPETGFKDIVRDHDHLNG